MQGCVNVLNLGYMFWLNAIRLHKMYCQQSFMYRARHSCRRNCARGEILSAQQLEHSATQSNSTIYYIVGYVLSQTKIALSMWRKLLRQVFGRKICVCTKKGMKCNHSPRVSLCARRHHELVWWISMCVWKLLFVEISFVSDMWICISILKRSCRRFHVFFILYLSTQLFL